MTAKPTIVDPLADLDSASQVPQEAAEPAPGTDPKDAELEALRAALAARDDEVAKLKDAMEAKSTAYSDPDVPLDNTVAKSEDEKILLHFVNDGFTALGQVWYRGQELEFVVGSQAWKDTHGTDGASWLDLLDDPAAQERRFRGKVMFRRGPWPGEVYEDGEATQAEVARRRRPPTISRLSRSRI